MSFSHDDYLAHHGIKGQRWGVRRYQNPDGTLTPDGELHLKVITEKRGLRRDRKMNSIAMRSAVSQIGNLSTHSVLASAAARHGMKATAIIIAAHGAKRSVEISRQARANRMYAQYSYMYDIDKINNKYGVG